MQEHIKIGDHVQITWSGSNLPNGYKRGDITVHLIIGRSGARPVILIRTPDVGWYVSHDRLSQCNIDNKYLERRGWMVNIEYHDVIHYCQNTVNKHV